MHIQPYLSFEGRCEEALGFYREALGAEITGLLRYRDSPQPPEGLPGDKIMHAGLKVGETEILANDGQCRGAGTFTGISLVLYPGSAEEARKTFSALSEGGQVRMPLGPTFFAASFGAVADRFGVEWMVLARD